MELIKRVLNISLPKGQSAFLWGARKSGKTTYLKQTFPSSVYFDLLKTDLYFSFLKNPSLMREQILASDKQVLQNPVIIDEIQKIPQLLDEVHYLIESEKIKFILSGSSARKLKRNRVNLLGGRAWRYFLFPLTYYEIKNFNLLQALNRGLIPAHYFDQNYSRSLRSYVQDYLKQEVMEEGLTRNIPAFSRFFDAISYGHGELTNFSNIARECGVDSKTVKEYYYILVDTLLGTFLEPFKRKQERQVINKASKFYLFDVGVAGILSGRTISEEKGEQFGKAFEHFIYMELLAHKTYTELEYKINFWRTKAGQEVDFILNNGEVAIEVKGSGSISPADMKSLKTFMENYKCKKAILVTNEKYIRKSDLVDIYPWKIFLDKLWSGEIIH